MHRLLPFSLAELKSVGFRHDIEKLLTRGGFPEPFLAESDVEAQRWRGQYIDGLIRTDVLDFENIHNFRAIGMILELLRRRVGSPVSYSSIAEDVQVSPITVKKYIDILEDLFIIFKIVPHSKNIARSILKEPKIYFYDTGMVIGDEGARFENFVALSLLKDALGKSDYTGENHAVKYLRTKEGKETDFVLIKNEEIKKLIEVKLSDRELSNDLSYFSEKYNLHGIQLVKHLKKEKSFGKIDIISAEKYLEELFL